MKEQYGQHLDTYDLDSEMHIVLCVCLAHCLKIGNGALGYPLKKRMKIDLLLLLLQHFSRHKKQLLRL